MTTREENLKKINAELENLSDEELENIAGGTTEEMDEDTKRFKELNIYVEPGGGVLGNDLWRASLENAFEKHGVQMISGFSAENKYFINGKQVSRDEAWKHIYSKLKK